MRPAPRGRDGRGATASSVEGGSRAGVAWGLAFLAGVGALLALSWSRGGHGSPETPLVSGPQVRVAPPPLVPAPEEPTVLVPVRVSFVDSLTGDPLPGARWREQKRLEPSDLTERWDAAWRRSGEAALFPSELEGIVVDPPQGYVALPALVIPSFPIPRARAAVLTVPLDREAIVNLAPGPGFFDESLRLHVAEVEVDGVRLPSEVLQVGDRLRGIPFRSGARLRLVLCYGGGTPGAWCGTGRMEGGGSAPDGLEWVGRMGEDPTTPLVVDPVLPRGAIPAPRFEGGAEPWEETSLVEPGDITPGGGVVDLTVRGTVRVRLLDRSGRPASGVQVAVRSVGGRTDSEGRVTLERVPGGEHVLRVLDEGWVFPLTPVAVAGDQVSEVVARELPGGELEVRVQDADGRPVPCAVLSFRRDDRRSVWDLDERDVRRLDPYVGADGRRVLAHVPPGVLHVRAKVGPRAGQARVEIVDGARRVVTIELPRLPPPPP